MNVIHHNDGAPKELKFVMLEDHIGRFSFLQAKRKLNQH